MPGTRPTLTDSRVVRAALARRGKTASDRDIEKIVSALQSIDREVSRLQGERLEEAAPMSIPKW